MSDSYTPVRRLSAGASCPHREVRAPVRPSHRAPRYAPRDDDLLHA